MRVRRQQAETTGRGCGGRLHAICVVAALLVALLPTRGSSAGTRDAGFALRLVPEILFSDVAVDAMGTDGRDLLALELASHLQSEVSSAFPEAWQAGAARADSDDMQRELEGLLHLALRISRYQVREVRYGDEKTVFCLYLTGSLSVLNLGTGEVLEGRVATALRQDESLGPARGRSLAALRASEARAARALIETLVSDLADRFAPGLIEVDVVGRHGGRDVLARGYMDGGYAGEVFQLPEGGHVRVVQVQERLSLAEPLTPGARALAGAVVRRFGQPAAGSKAPRLMVIPAQADVEVAPGVSGGELAQWLSDGLAKEGFPVLPTATDLDFAQFEEAATIDVSREQLVGNMVRPDIYVVPWVVRHGVLEQEDPEREANVYLLSVEVGCSFVDASNGVVLHGARVVGGAEEYTRESGRQTDVLGAFVGLTKDAAAQLAAETFESFKPSRAYGTVLGPVSATGSLKWRLDGPALGRGTIGELLARSKDFTNPRTGEGLGPVESLIGTVRTTGRKAAVEEGRLLASSQAVATGQRIRAVVGSSRAGGSRVIALGTVTARSNRWLPERRLFSIGQAVLGTSGLFRALLDDRVAPELMTIREQLETSESYALEGRVGTEQTAATHRLDLEVEFTVGAAEEHRRLVERTFRVDLTGTLVDLETGKPEILHSPSKGEVEQYQMWLEHHLKAKKRGDSVLVGFAEQDIDTQLETLTIAAIQELLRRLALLVATDG